MVYRSPHIGDVLPFTPLPTRATQAAYDSILNVGFASEAILEAYHYTSKSGTFILNALAFNDPKRCTPDEYAGITLYNATNGKSDEQIIPILAQTAAPFHIIHREECFAFWASTIHETTVQPIAIETDIPYDRLDAVLQDYAVDLNPSRMTDIKQGRAQFAKPYLRDRVKTRQLALWAFDITRDLLVEHFASAVTSLRANLQTHRRHSTQRDDTILHLAIQLLGAVILADTGVLGDEIRHTANNLSLHHLIEAAYSQHPRYFQRDLFEQHTQAAADALAELRQIRYAGFVPDMLSELYRTAYDANKRKELGRFDTPLYLTRRIWDTIPVEFLKPEQRYTVDMTCGWGSFLIAGYDRLSRITDMRSYHLREYLHGNDLDQFTARLAALGLLLSTSVDSWHVDAEDALTWHWLDQHQPGIIVGNPPFGGDRKTRKEDTSLPQEQRKRYQEADFYLDKAITHLAPGGYLALLMPCSFVAAEASPQLRKKLLETCNVLEIWELPIEVFPEATAGTLMLCAQKKITSSTAQYSVRIRSVQKQTLERFASAGVFTSSGIASDQSKWNETSRKSKGSKNTYIIDYQLILPEYAWQQIRESCINVSKRAIVFSGAIVGQTMARKRWKDYDHPKVVPWLTGARDVLSRPFVIDYEQATTIRYPNDLERPRKDYRSSKEDKEHLLAGTKVLLTSDPNPSWGKRVKIAIERRGHYVSHSFWVLVPHPDSMSLSITHEVLAAVLNWYVSNAWVVEHLKYPWIVKRAILTIPFPRYLSDDDCEALTQAVLQLEAAAYANQPEPQEATETIDAILKTAYRLDDATFARLRMIARWDQHPHETLDPLPDRSQANYIISGIVDQVNAAQGTITLWMSGFDDLQTVPIDPMMPGWMLRPDVAFRAKIPYACDRSRSLDHVIWGSITPQNYTYLSEEELVESLSRVFGV